MILNDAWYNRLKWLATIFLPASAAAYFALSGFWNLPNALEVVGSVTVVETFIGALIGLSTHQYNKELEKTHEADAGTISQSGTDPETGMPYLHIEFNKAPDELLSKDTLTIQTKGHDH